MNDKSFLIFTKSLFYYSSQLTIPDTFKTDILGVTELRTWYVVIVNELLPFVATLYPEELPWVKTTLTLLNLYFKSSEYTWTLKI